MKPVYWIGILALAGAVVGYAVFQTVGWLGPGLGAVLGILVGAVLYSAQKSKLK